MATCHLCEHEIEMARAEPASKGSSGFVIAIILMVVLAAGAYFLLPHLKLGRVGAPASPARVR